MTCPDCLGTLQVVVTTGGTYASGRPAEDRDAPCTSCIGGFTRCPGCGERAVTGIYCGKTCEEADHA